MLDNKGSCASCLLDGEYNMTLWRLFSFCYGNDMREAAMELSAMSLGAFLYSIMRHVENLSSLK